jgi:hypothetical protein
MCTESSSTVVTRQLLHEANGLTANADSRMASRDSLKHNSSAKDLIYLRQQEEEQRRHACFEQQDNRLFVIELFLHAADVSNPAKVNTYFHEPLHDDAVVQ